MRVSIIGNGVVGKSYNKVFPDAYIYDEPQGIGTREEVNKCDIALVAVPTNLKEDGTLDMSIVEDVVSWLETPLILIKSALNPGTVDRLVEKTGKKIAVSVEFIGEGKYFVPYWKYPHQDDPRMHNFLIVGGEEETATKCAEILWDKMSPDIKIHIVSAKEAEMCKLIENTYGALKVTWINAMYNLVTKAGGNFIKTHQAWSADGRVDGVHLRTTSFKRGWASKCWDKDPKALQTFAESVGATDMAKLISLMHELNAEHLKESK